MMPAANITYVRNENINFGKGKPFSHYYEFSKCLEYLRFPMFRIGEEILQGLSDAK